MVFVQAQQQSTIDEYLDLVLEPGRFREKAGEIGFVRTLESTTGNIGQAFVIQDDQAF